MSDPNAKKMKAAKRYGRSLDLIKQGLQLNQWSLIPLDDQLFVIGKREMCFYVKELLNEQLRQESGAISATGSLELGASLQDDSEASRPSEPLQKVGASGD